MKIINYDNLKLNNTAVALGKFQGLHKGHMLLVENVCSLAAQEKLTSVIFTINMGQDFLINLPEERNGILEACNIDANVECDFTEEFAAMSPEQFVKDILVDRLGAVYVVVGTDFRFGCKRAGDVNTLKEYGEKYGFKVIDIEKLSIDDTIVSSSYIRKLISEGNVKQVAKYMGRDYTLCGQIVEGRKLGRTIGFPTINIIPNSNKILPAFGAYATEVLINGVYYKGLTNVGDNPTIDENNMITVETHLLDCNEDLYGKNAVVYFKEFIRHEMKFNNVSELMLQLNKDKEYVLHQ